VPGFNHPHGGFFASQSTRNKRPERMLYAIVVQSNTALANSSLNDKNREACAIDKVMEIA
jgi:hypothetical protein